MQIGVYRADTNPAFTESDNHGGETFFGGLGEAVPAEVIEDLLVIP
jgi:hypothetical protein